MMHVHDVKPPQVDVIKMRQRNHLMAAGEQTALVSGSSSRAWPASSLSWVYRSSGGGGRAMVA